MHARNESTVLHTHSYHLKLKCTVNLNPTFSKENLADESVRINRVRPVHTHTHTHTHARARARAHTHLHVSKIFIYTCDIYISLMEIKMVLSDRLSYIFSARRVLSVWDLYNLSKLSIIYYLPLVSFPNIAKLFNRCRSGHQCGKVLCLFCPLFLKW